MCIYNILGIHMVYNSVLEWNIYSFDVTADITDHHYNSIFLHPIFQFALSILQKQGKSHIISRCVHIIGLAQKYFLKEKFSNNHFVTNLVNNIVNIFLLTLTDFTKSMLKTHLQVNQFRLKHNQVFLQLFSLQISGFI